MTWVFALQAVLMLVDEFVCHYRREVPKWERVGHPVDTLTVFLPLAVTIFFAPNANTEIVFIALSVFSCVCITKDEWIHARHCSGFEHWLHAMLFVLHPVLFFVAYRIWHDADANAFGAILLKGQTVAVFIFFFYQVWFWNLRGVYGRSK